MTSLVIYAVVACLVSVFAWHLFLEEEVAQKQRKEYLTEQSWMSRLEKAKTLALETDNFSPEFYQVAAREIHDDILKKAAKTRKEKAQREIRAKQTEKLYEQIATYAARDHGLTEEETVQMLRTASEHQYRLLQEAIKIETQEAA